MTVFIIVISYLLISAVLYLAMRKKCRKNAVFAPLKSELAFFIISFTWGAPKTAAGILAAIFVVLFGYKPKKSVMGWCFEIPGIDWGLELGVFFIVPKDGSERMKAHELGHGIQNVYLGIFTPLVVSLPSALRFWYRRIRERLGRPCTAGYDDIWFEKSATESGLELMKKTINRQKR